MQLLSNFRSSTRLCSVLLSFVRSVGRCCALVVITVIVVVVVILFLLSSQSAAAAPSVTVVAFLLLLSLMSTKIKTYSQFPQITLPPQNSAPHHTGMYGKTTKRATKIRSKLHSVSNGELHYSYAINKFSINGDNECHYKERTGRGWVWERKDESFPLISFVFKQK